MTSTEFLISFSIIMMMLSLVSERAANFFKLYFQGKILYIPFLYKLKSGWITHLKVKLEILAYKQPTAAAEKEREYRLMVINILIGIVIATLANANFFEIVKQISSGNKEALGIRGFVGPFDQPEYIIGFFYMLFFLWSLSVILFSRLQEYNSQIKQYIYKYPFILWLAATAVLVLVGRSDDSYERYLDIVTHCLGYIFVGLFLSLGSKFWHDLLDVLFKLKNTQQVLSDPKTYTQYGNADQLVALAETSQYEVAEKLFALYKNEIAAISGVVSYGLNTIIDEKTKLYRKIIEVEFTTPEAQSQLMKIQNKGSLFLNYNTFYLKDYLVMRYTTGIVAVSGIDATPVCYAYNESSPDSKGSFSVFEKDGAYFAESNLHVFAADDEFKNFEADSNYKLTKLNVRFQIDDAEAESGQIIDYKFGTIGVDGIDYCLCTINKKTFEAYQKTIKVDELKSVSEYEMKMFGSTSKYVNFHTFKEGTMCDVKYGSFTKKLYLFKIGTATPGISNIDFGDSGSLVYYKVKASLSEYKIYHGMIVAKSDHYAYMFLK